MAVMTELQQKISSLLQDVEVRFEELLSKHTSFRIGGPAEIMAFPKNADQLRKVLEVSAQLDIKPAILGAGTNVLAPDDGLRGMIICLKDCLSGMELLEGNRIRVMAGVTMTRAAVFAADRGLTGLEFSHGIPGTVGGGVYMNAGAYGSEISNVCECVEVMSPEGDIRTYSCEEMEFSYRHSVLEVQGGIVISAVFRLTAGDPAEIKARMKELQTKRSASQPLQLPSAGSAFKRPVGGYAAALIDQTGLKGFQIGGAAVSEKHAGFVVNLGGATASDVCLLLKEVAQKVLDTTGIYLEPEIRIW